MIRFNGCVVQVGTNLLFPRKKFCTVMFAERRFRIDAVPQSIESMPYTSVPDAVAFFQIFYYRPEPFWKSGRIRFVRLQSPVVMLKPAVIYQKPSNWKFVVMKTFRGFQQ